MQIDFHVHVGDETLPSDVALQRAVELAEDLTRPWDIEGRWELRSDDLELAWDDTLVPLIQVCLEALVPLLETGHAVASRTTEYGYLRMDVEGEWVRLGGDGLPSGRVAIRPFVEGQLRCAGQLAGLLVALGMDGFDVKALREDRRAAAMAWAAWKPVEGGPDVLGPIPAAPPRREAEGAVRLERGESLVLRCGGESFVFPGDPDAWLARLVEDVLPVLGPDVHRVLPRGGGYGWFRVDGEGDQVRLSGDGLADLRLPLGGLEGVLRNTALA
ncbi:MAG: hypothetical protein H6737_24495 [Alphaproteobacteria bacterium]|nr:hypothetical protein [Alphaproteobacteria bacterium]